MFRFSSSKSQEEIPAPPPPSTDQDQAPPSLIDETVVAASLKDDDAVAVATAKKQKREASAEDDDVVIIESSATSKKQAPKASAWEPPTPRERKVAAEKQLLKVVDGLTSKYEKKKSPVAVTTIKNDDDDSSEEKKNSNKKRKIDDDECDDDAFSLRTVESEEIYIDIDKIPSMDESSNQNEPPFVETIQTQENEEVNVEENKESSSDLSMHASDVDDDIDLDSTTRVSVSSPTGSDEDGSNDDPAQIRLRARSILSQASQSSPPTIKKADDDHISEVEDQPPTIPSQDHYMANILASESHHTADVPVDVGNSLLKDALEEKQEEEQESKEETEGAVQVSTATEKKKEPRHFCGKLLFLIIVTLVGTAMMPRSQDISSVLQPASEEVDVRVEQNSTLAPTDAPSPTDSSASSFLIQELLDEETPLEVIGNNHPDETEQDDNAIPATTSSQSSFGDTFKMAGMMGFIFFLALSKPSAQDNDGDEGEDDDDEIVNQVKTEGFECYDLSNYEDLKVVELRGLLRQRGCKTIGRKHVLIRRLASVYKAELDTMTVKQLRRFLKSKGFKQGGLKWELIQKLVEAGCM